MEENLKRDVLRELRIGNGRVLLHDEVEERPGTFSIIPIWETVTEADILTPRDVVELIGKEGYRVSLAQPRYSASYSFINQIDYARVAIVRHLSAKYHSN